MVRCYSQRLVNPFRGILSVVETEDADAVSSDGLHWSLYIHGEIEDVRMNIVPAHDHLNDTMEIGERPITRDSDTAPHARSRIVQREIEIEHARHRPLDHKKPSTLFVFTVPILPNSAIFWWRQCHVLHRYEPPIALFGQGTELAVEIISGPPESLVN